MSKITTYLNEHLAGEIISSGPELAAVSVDGSVLSKRPEMLVSTANTSDVRKVARFCWQLAEKGHVLPITARGNGTDMTGAAIGSGIILSHAKYMNRIVGIDPGQRLIHVQAGAPYQGVKMALSTHKGLTLPNESFDGTTGTIGGAIASGVIGHMNSRYGSIGGSVTQLEVVLASGEVLQTVRLSKRELNAKKGLQTMEGEIYRRIDNLITDNQEMILSLAAKKVRDSSGYSNITRVKNKDGSIDLTPLFVGSQGSLGIITEAIVKAQFARQELTAVLVSYSDISDALSAVDAAAAMKATSIELIDGRLLKRAALQGKKRDFAPEESFTGGLVVAIYDDFGEKARNKSAKKLYQQLQKTSSPASLTVQNFSLADLAGIKSILSLACKPVETSIVTPSLFRGIWLPHDQIDVFLADLKQIEKSHNIQLPVYADIKSGLIDVLPIMNVTKISDRQKIIKLLSEFADMLPKYGGSLSGQGGDGRIKAAVVTKNIRGELLELYKQIKEIFDPHNILNPGVKQQVPAKDLVAQLNDWCRLVIAKHGK